MSVKIRLTRKGSKKKPIYRIVIADSRSPRDGRFIDQVGYYDPNKDPADIRFHEDKVSDWLGKGAQPTSIVKQLLKKAGISSKTISS